MPLNRKLLKEACNTLLASLHALHNEPVGSKNFPSLERLATALSQIQSFNEIYVSDPAWSAGFQSEHLPLFKELVAKAEQSKSHKTQGEATRSDTDADKSKELPSDAEWIEKVHGHGARVRFERDNSESRIEI